MCGKCDKNIQGLDCMTAPSVAEASILILSSLITRGSKSVDPVGLSIEIAEDLIKRLGEKGHI